MVFILVKWHPPPLNLAKTKSDSLVQLSLTLKQAILFYVILTCPNKELSLYAGTFFFAPRWLTVNVIPPPSHPHPKEQYNLNMTLSHYYTFNIQHIKLKCCNKTWFLSMIQLSIQHIVPFINSRVVLFFVMGSFLFLFV